MGWRGCRSREARGEVKTTVFRYKQKLFPKLMLLVAFLAFPDVFRRHHLYASLPYWSIFVALQGLVHGYFAAKRIVVSEQGVDTRFLGMRVAFAPWAAVQDLNIAAPGPELDVGKGGLLDAAEPFAKIRWLVRRSAGTTIRLTVAGIEPLVFCGNELKNGAELGPLLRSRIPVA
jgi:hypothetical protein